MNQLPITFIPEHHARTDDPATSKNAARQAERFAGSHCGRILSCLKAHGPQTVDQIATGTGLQSQQVNKRLPDLQRAGLALPTSMTAKSKAGINERIWVAT